MRTDKKTSRESATLKAARPEPRSDPRLSIGLPVFNGARHLRQAIDSLLAQDVDDLELVISDNASTDSTAAICMEYAAADERVRYTRNDENVGAAANFNRVFELCSGRYFMWGSHDDLWDPRFARLCIERLEKSPEAVACTSRMAVIRDNGDPAPEFVHDSIDTGGMAVDARVHELIAQVGWFGIYYSVFRPEALRATQLYRPAYGGDICLLLQLALLGPSVSVPETLFFYRTPDNPRTPSESLAAIYPEGAPHEGRDELMKPYTQIARNLLKVVRESALDEATIACIEEDFVDTLGFENRDWRDEILRESGLPPRPGLSAASARSVIREALGIGGASPAPGANLPVPRAWVMSEGIRLTWLRHPLLRLLKPFGDRQDDLNELAVRQVEALEQVEHEVRWLRRRVRELERRDA